MTRRASTLLVGVTVALLLAGCTTTPEPDRAVSASPSPSGSTVVASSSGPAPSTGPIDTGPTTTADGTCPFLTMDQALNDLGERLGRITVSKTGTTVAGCAFYPATGALASSEHLPPPSVPVIAITLGRFTDDTTAHNAMVVSSQDDPAAYSDPTPGTDEAISFATTFYPADGNQDRAFTFRKGTTVVLVRVAQTTPAFNAKHLGTDVAAALK